MDDAGGNGSGEQRQAERLIVVVLMIVAAYTAAYYSISLFPEGRYSRLVLAIPGVIAGAAVYGLYFIASRILRTMKGRK